jgi:hypothetical protein
MAIQYAGGTRVNYTFTDAGTRADLVSKLETKLGTAGWSTISGGGSSDVLMKSAVTPDGLSIRLRLYDPGSGNCAQFTIKNNAGTLTSQIHYLLPGSVEWRIIANKYWFLMFRTGAAARVAARGYLAGGTIWVPSFVLTQMGSDLDCGFLLAHGVSDSDATIGVSWRNWLLDTRRASSLYTSFMIDVSADGVPAQPYLMAPSVNINSTANIGVAWQGGDRHQMEALIAWAPGSTSTSSPTIKGQLFDAIVLSGKATGESTITFDGHTWIAVTDQCDYNIRGAGSLYVAVD